MCIRDRFQAQRAHGLYDEALALLPAEDRRAQKPGLMMASICLLYTSDAADERSSVDLGGRRIIKKKSTGKE